MIGQFVQLLLLISRHMGYPLVVGSVRLFRFAQRPFPDLSRKNGMAQETAGIPALARLCEKWIKETVTSTPCLFFSNLPRSFCQRCVHRVTGVRKSVPGARPPERGPLACDLFPGSADGRARETVPTGHFSLSLPEADTVLPSPPSS